MFPAARIERVDSRQPCGDPPHFDRRVRSPVSCELERCTRGNGLFGQRAGSMGRRNECQSKRTEVGRVDAEAVNTPAINVKSPAKRDVKSFTPLAAYYFSLEIA